MTLLTPNDSEDEHEGRLFRLAVPEPETSNPGPRTRTLNRERQTISSRTRTIHSVLFRLNLVFIPSGFLSGSQAANSATATRTRASHGHRAAPLDDLPAVY
jgi:hypothetical protein